MPSTRKTRPRPAPALLFAALGDETRLALVTRLATGKAASITELTQRSRLSRQAITKHLRVLERAGMVRSMRSGRESLFELDPAPLSGIEEYIRRVSSEWDAALMRLKSFVEE